MTPFRRRWEWNNEGDIRTFFWSDYLIKKRLFKGLDEAGRRLVKCPIGRILF